MPTHHLLLYTGEPFPKSGKFPPQLALLARRHGEIMEKHPADSEIFADVEFPPFVDEHVPHGNGDILCL